MKLSYNQDKVVFGYSSLDVYFSTNTAPWVSIAGCYIVSKLRGDAVGVACGAIVQASNQFPCPCGYIYSKGYGFHWTTVTCQ